MSTPPAPSNRSRCQRATEQLYRLLLHAYPPAFRAEYGGEMMQVFRDQCRAENVGAIAFWVSVAWDVLQSAPALHVNAWHERQHVNTGTGRLTMKLVAMMAVLAGTFEILNAAGEGIVGGRHGSGSAHLAAVLLGLAAAVLLLVAGVAVLRGPATRRRSAMRAAIVSIAALVAARLTFGWMSIFSQLVGLAPPITIVSMLYWTGRRGSSLSRT